LNSRHRNAARRGFALAEVVEFNLERLVPEERQPGIDCAAVQRVFQLQIPLALLIRPAEPNRTLRHLRSVFAGIPHEELRRVRDAGWLLVFPWLYPPFPASCPFRSVMAHRGLPPHRTTPCRFPAAGSSSGFTTSPQGSSPGSRPIVGRVLGT